MLTVDESTMPSIVSVECDSPGCRKSHSLTSTCNDGGRSAINSLLIQMMDDGWFVRTDTDTIQHFCPKCGPSEDGVSQLSRRQYPNNPEPRQRMIGSQVPSELQSSVVSAQALRENRNLKPASEAVQIRAKRKRDEERGTPGLSEIDDKQRNALKAKLQRGLKIFGEDE